MWRLNALLRMNLPVAVFLNRLAAPRCVFNFGIFVSSLFTARGAPPPLALARRRASRAALRPRARAAGALLLAEHPLRLGFFRLRFSLGGGLLPDPSGQDRVHL